MRQATRLAAILQANFTIRILRVENDQDTGGGSVIFTQSFAPSVSGAVIYAFRSDDIKALLAYSGPSRKRDEPIDDGIPNFEYRNTDANLRNLGLLLSARAPALL